MEHRICHIFDLRNIGSCLIPVGYCNRNHWLYVWHCTKKGNFLKHQTPGQYVLTLCRVNPVVPKSWKKMTITYYYGICEFASALGQDGTKICLMIINHSNKKRTFYFIDTMTLTSESFQSTFDRVPVTADQITECALGWTIYTGKRTNYYSKLEFWVINVSNGKASLKLITEFRCEGSQVTTGSNVAVSNNYFLLCHQCSVINLYSLRETLEESQNRDWELTMTNVDDKNAKLDYVFCADYNRFYFVFGAKLAIFEPNKCFLFIEKTLPGDFRLNPWNLMPCVTGDSKVAIFSGGILKVWALEPPTLKELACRAMQIGWGREHVDDHWIGGISEKEFRQITGYQRTKPPF